VNRPLVLVLFVLSAFSAFPQCDLKPRVVGDELQWDSPPGTVRFSVQSLVPGRAPTYYQTTQNAIPLKHRATKDTSVRYIVTAEIMDGTQEVDSADACLAFIDVPVAADPAFRVLVRRSIIPIAGSTGGALGGKFRTALELRGLANMKGRVFFHPANRVASESDPSLPYSFVGQRVLRWNDVVEAMGQSGIGSISLVPDADSIDELPQAIARIYNDTPIGTFGSQVPALPAAGYLPNRSIEIPIPDAKFRTNIGIRTLTETKVKVVTYSAANRITGFRDLTFPAGWTTMMSAADLTKETIEPGGSVVLLVNGSAMAFYTVTENQTNDSTVVVAAAPPQSTDVSLIVE
jgi:hypothetical protein